MKLSLALLSLATFCGLSYAAPAVVGPGTVTGNTAVHDPTMCKDSAGKYYVFCESFLCSMILLETERDASATGVGLEIRTSTDRTAWTMTGLVFPNGASWTDPYTGTSNG